MSPHQHRVRPDAGLRLASTRGLHETHLVRLVTDREALRRSLTGRSSRPAPAGHAARPRGREAS